MKGINDFCLNRFSLYLKLMRFDKPIGTLLLLWPTLWALWIASKGEPNLFILIIFTLGVFLTRSAGCIINDLIDRDLDQHVRRTKERPLAQKKISVAEAIILATLLLMFALYLVLQLNKLTIMLAMFCVLLIIIYPFMKRVLPLPQFVLGITFSWGVPMAFAAQTNKITGIAWLLFLTSFLWIVAYDTMYAMADREDDKIVGIQSSALLFGKHDRLMVGMLQFFVIALLVYIGIYCQLNFWYYLSVATAAGLAIYQQILIIDRKPEKCIEAFINNHWFGLSVFLGILLSYISCYLY